MLNPPTYKFYIPIGAFIMYFTISHSVMFMLLSGWISGSLLYDGMHLAFHFEDDYDGINLTKVFQCLLPGSWF